MSGAALRRRIRQEAAGWASRLILLAIVVSVLPPLLAAQAAVDFSSCASALDDVSSSADDAASKARDAESAQDEFESENDDWDRCRRFPEIYDLLQDGCRSKRRDTENARDELESAISDLESALGDLDSAMDDVQSSCGYTLAAAAPISGVGSAHGGMCTKLRRLKATMKPQEVSDLCKRVMSESECVACLSAP